jgi:hypothetical protein
LVCLFCLFLDDVFSAISGVSFFCFLFFFLTTRVTRGLQCIILYSNIRNICSCSKFNFLFFQGALVLCVSLFYIIFVKWKPTK